MKFSQTCPKRSTIVPEIYDSSLIWPEIVCKSWRFDNLNYSPDCILGQCRALRVLRCTDTLCRRHNAIHRWLFQTLESRVFRDQAWLEITSRLLRDAGYWCVTIQFLSPVNYQRGDIDVFARHFDSAVSDSSASTKHQVQFVIVKPVHGRHCFGILFSSPHHLASSSLAVCVDCPCKLKVFSLTECR